MDDRWNLRERKCRRLRIALRLNNDVEHSPRFAGGAPGQGLTPPTFNADLVPGAPLPGQPGSGREVPLAAGVVAAVVPTFAGRLLDILVAQRTAGVQPERAPEEAQGAGSVRAALHARVKGARLAVLSDPAGVSTYAGTYEDVLIPHALLNATACGLLSQPVPKVKGRHTARREEGLTADDRTTAYLDAVSTATPAFQERGQRPGHPVEYTLMITAMYSVTDPRHIHPGVGEASRALLQRASCELLLRQRGHPDTQHLEHEARRRRVAVYVHADLPYQACMQ